MLSILDQTASPADRVSRREWLQVGGLSSLGLSLPHLLLAGEAPRRPDTTPRLAGDLGSTFGKAKNVIFLWLQGGPPQHETFDPKPDAPAEIRGEFKPIATNVPGIRFCELLPRTARYADKLAVVRSLSTDNDNHDVSGYWLLTGYPYGPGSARQIKPTDWPYFGSIVKMLKPSERLPALTSVWLPDWMRLNDNVTPAGQTAGFLGKMWEPERFVGDPAAPDYQIEGLGLVGDVTRPASIAAATCWRSSTGTSIRRGASEAVEAWDRLSQHAFDLVTSGTARAAFDLAQGARPHSRPLRPAHLGAVGAAGPAADRGGRAAGPRQLVARPGRRRGRQPDVGHARPERRPAAGQPLPAVRRHLRRADGRPRRPRAARRDAGRRDRRVRPHAADQQARRPRPLGARLQLRAGRGRHSRRAGDRRQRQERCLSGDRPDPRRRPHGHHLPPARHRPARHVPRQDQPAAPAHEGRADRADARARRRRRPSAASRAATRRSFRPTTTSLLLDTDFRSKLATGAARPALASEGMASVPNLERQDRHWPRCPEGGRRSCSWATASTDEKSDAVVEAGSRVLLAQEIRNARGGHYTFTVKATGVGSSIEEFEKSFLANMTCRLILFRFRDTKKDARTVEELASAEFRPSFGKTETFKVDRFLGSKVPGANFPIGNGLGVAVVVEKKIVRYAPLAEGRTPHGRPPRRLRHPRLQPPPPRRERDVVTTAQ